MTESGCKSVPFRFRRATQTLAARISAENIAIVAICLGLLLVRRKNANGISSISDFATIPPIAQVSTQAGPQLPPEGLPVGWTMEQWAWYGDDYLKNR